MSNKEILEQILSFHDVKIDFEYQIFGIASTRKNEDRNTVQLIFLSDGLIVKKELKDLVKGSKSTEECIDEIYKFAICLVVSEGINSFSNEPTTR